jgi:hypothetical protein
VGPLAAATPPLGPPPAAALGTLPVAPPLPPVAALPADPADPVVPADVVLVAALPDWDPLPVPDPPSPDPGFPEALAAANWAAVSRAPHAVETSVIANRTTRIELLCIRREPRLGWMGLCDLELVTPTPLDGKR